MPLSNDGDQLYVCGDKRKVVFIRKSNPYQQYGTPCSEECHPNLAKKTNRPIVFRFKWTTQQPCKICWKWEAWEILIKISGLLNLILNQITITAEYLPGKLNVRADWHSHQSKDFSQFLAALFDEGYKHGNSYCTVISVYHEKVGGTP